MDLTNPLHRTQFTEGRQGSNKELVNVWLPKVLGIDFETMMKLREDEGDSFQKLRKAFGSFLTTKPESETDIVDLASLVDLEVHRLCDRMQAAKRASRRSLAQMSIGTGAVSLCFAIPNEVAATLAAMASGAIVAPGISAFIGAKERQFDLRASDYWVGWRVNQSNESNRVH